MLLQLSSLPLLVLLLLLTLSTTTLAKPEGYYHQEYQYTKSAASFKNNELQHKNDDEGFYTKDGDLSGSQDPKVNQQHEHREFINPKLRAQGYTGQDFTGTGSGIDLQRRAQQFIDGHNTHDFGTTGLSSGYQQSGLNSGTTLSSNMQSFMSNLQYDMQRQLERQLQQWRDSQQEYANAHTQNSQNRYSSTSSGLYSPSTVSVESMRRDLQDEIRTNLTRELDLRNRVSQYDNTDLNDIKQQLQDNLMRQLNDLMREQEQGGSTSYTSSHGTAIKTKSANYAPSVIETRHPHSSYEQDDLNSRQQKYYQEQRPLNPEPYQYSPSSSRSAGSSHSGHSTTYGSTAQSGTTNYIAQRTAPITPTIRNNNQITEIAQQVQHDVQQVLIKALDQYQRENSFNPSNKYQAKPDYHYAKQDFESRLRYNLTDYFETILDRNFGPQDLRGQYYFSRGEGATNQQQQQQQQQQRYANYKVDDYERLKQQVEDNLQKFLRDSLKTQEEYYETQRSAYSTSSSSSYTTRGQYQSAPYQEDHYNQRPTSLGQQQQQQQQVGGSNSRSYSSSSSYSGSAAYQAESRPQRTGGAFTKTNYPTAGYRASTDTLLYGTFTKYPGRGDQHSSSTNTSLEDCDESMQGDDPQAHANYAHFGAHSKPLESNLRSYQTPSTYNEDLRRPLSSTQHFQRPATSSLEDYQRPLSSTEDFQSSIEDFQRPLSSMEVQAGSTEDYQRPLSNLETFQRPVDYARGYQRPSSHLYDVQRPVYNVYQRTTTGKPTSNMFAPISVDYQRPLSSMEDQANSADDQRPVYNSRGYQRPSSHFYDVQRPVYQRTTTAKPTSNMFAPISVDYDEDILRVSPLEQAGRNIDIEIDAMASKNSLSTEREIFTTPKTTESSSNLRQVEIDEIAQKLKDSIEDFHEDAQQKTLVDDYYDDLRLTNQMPSPPSPRPNFNHFYGTTEKDFSKPNNDYLRIINPSSYYTPYTITPIPLITTPKVDTYMLNLGGYYQKTTPKYNFLAVEPIYEQYNKPTSTEGPKVMEHDLQQHVENSYEDIPVHQKPLFIIPHRPPPYQLNKPFEPANFEVQKPVHEMTQEDPKSSKKYPEDEEFLDNILRERKATNVDEEDEEIEDFGQKPIEVRVSSHRGDIDSFAKPNHVEAARELPIRLADISRYNNEQYQQEDDSQKPVETSFDLQSALEDDYDQLQTGRRLPDKALTERAYDQLHENIHKQEIKPIYLSSDYNINADDSALENVRHNSTENPGFWKKFGGKITNTYNNAKQKARQMVEQINLL